MDKLLEFRITSPTIVATTPNGFEDTVSRIRELCADDKEIRLSTIHLSLSQVGNDINRDVLTERVLRLVEISMEDGFEVCSKSWNHMYHSVLERIEQCHWCYQLTHYKHLQRL